MLRAQGNVNVVLAELFNPRHSWLRPTFLCAISALFSAGKKNMVLHESSCIFPT